MFQWLLQEYTGFSGALQQIIKETQPKSCLPYLSTNIAISEPNPEQP